MAGRLIEIIGKQAFTMNFASTGNALTVLGNRVNDVTDAVSGVLLVRVASCSGIPTGGVLSIGVSNQLVLPDDPSTIYSLTSGGAIANVQIAATDTGFPRLYASGFTASSSPPCGPMVGCGLQAIYGSAAGTALVTLAVSLLIRDT